MKTEEMRAKFENVESLRDLIGTPVYICDPFDGVDRIRFERIKDININSIGTSVGIENYICVPPTEFGSTIFLTCDEALESYAKNTEHIFCTFFDGLGDEDKSALKRILWLAPKHKIKNLQDHLISLMDSIYSSLDVKRPDSIQLKDVECLKTILVLIDIFLKMINEEEREES